MLIKNMLIASYLAIFGKAEDVLPSIADDEEYTLLRKRFEKELAIHFNGQTYKTLTVDLHLIRARLVEYDVRTKGDTDIVFLFLNIDDDDAIDVVERVTIL